MELDAHEPGVVFPLHDLHQAAVGGQSGQGQAAGLQLRPELVVELIAVAVPLGNVQGAVGFIGKGVLPGDPAGAGAQAHGAPLGGDPHLVGHEGDDRVLGGLGELPGVGVLHGAQVAGGLDDRHLHPQADAEEGNLVLPGVPHGGNHPLNAPVPEAAGHQDAVHPGQLLVGVFIGDRLRVHPADLHAHAVLDAAVGEGLHHRQIGVVEGHILAHQGDVHTALGALGPVDHGGPLGEVGGMTDQPQPAHHHVGQPLPLQHQGHLVEDVRRQVGNGVVHGDVAEQGDFLQNLLGQRVITAAQDYIRLNP